MVPEKKNQMCYGEASLPTNALLYHFKNIHVSWCVIILSLKYIHRFRPSLIKSTVFSSVLLKSWTCTLLAHRIKEKRATVGLNLTKII